MQPPKGKQATRGKKQIHEENQQTLRFYAIMSLTTTAFYYGVMVPFFWDRMTGMTLFSAIVANLLHLATWMAMKAMSRPQYDAGGNLLDPVTDLNIEKGLAEYLKDLIILTSIVQVLAVFSNYFWLLLLAIPAYVFYLLWTNFLGPWFFAPAPEEGDAEDNKSKKKERRQTKRVYVK